MNERRPASAGASAMGGRKIARDWSARTRGTILQSQEYSRFVALMKRVLPIGASVIIVAVLVFAFLPRGSEKITMVYQRMGKLANDLSMQQPRLSGTDQQGHPYVVTAGHAVQDPRHPHRVRLYDMEADITMDKNQWLNATAATGAFDMDSGALDLSGGIALFTDSGYELHTSHGHGNVNQGQFYGPNTVTGQGPLGTFRADNMRIDNTAKKIFLNGNVQMTMYLQKGEKKK
jgi:lipopolysaccharide export system protein LptC